MDNPISNEQAKEDQIQRMLDEHRKLKAVSKFKSLKEETITQKIQASTPHLSPEDAQKQAQRFLLMMCINDWDDIVL